MADIIVDGMTGIGDALHMRAVLKKLMRDHNVWLETCWYHPYHDLIGWGLKLIHRPLPWYNLKKFRDAEEPFFAGFEPPPPNAQRRKIWYTKAAMDASGGTILSAMFHYCGLRMEHGDADFSLPVPADWRRGVGIFDVKRAHVEGLKPLCIYRPITDRSEHCNVTQTRNPEPEVYNALFGEIRSEFFTISIADLEEGSEWIVGREPQADVTLHHGQLSFTDMVAMFASADLVFSPAGFAPVLAQAVGTPSITVYGLRESFYSTQRAGAHLAPSLGINPDRPCDCHDRIHGRLHAVQCSKHISIEPAKAKIQQFLTANIIAS